MLVKTSNTNDVLKARKYFNELLKQECKFQLKKVLETRTSKQNRALHLFFTFISAELNNLGIEFVYNGLKINEMTSRYTALIVKEFIWKPIQITMFDIQSTTKINTKQINEIIDVIIKYFGDKGVTLEFPNIEKLIN